jgi:hypothetical protein
MQEEIPRWNWQDSPLSRAFLRDQARWRPEVRLADDSWVRPPPERLRLSGERDGEGADCVQ